MQTIYLDPNAPINLPPIALTVGNYDGVHLGHQAMLSALIQDAASRFLSSAVMVFEPQPREFFAFDNPPPRLTSLAEKSHILAKLGVDFLLVVDFNQAFCSLTATEFAALLGRLNVQHLVLGDDFRFGSGRVGDRAFLRQAGFSVDSLKTITLAGDRISSTAVRQALQIGDLATAKHMLGRDYAITGVVVSGDKIGRTLDFPTANVALERQKPALQGVFGVDVFAYKDGERLSWSLLSDGQQTGVSGVSAGSLFGAANIGIRPSVGGADYRLEVYLPNFLGDLYGVTLKVVFLHYLHGERHYDSLDALKLGIAEDVRALLAWRYCHD
ncbi:bifunctional riboflavin kinase/FAD synthetase [Moraxella nasovis]|uniref:bifunctional riboflavin kinase/FAD synthetase n=1 Tax=Moraxella nasovis TaxID=2904121 RepID=UPI001F60B267|nr:bifunctional riboflavin kinase/FAD synthetase [Moraxella nasovis]UNU73730.1 bifunctional riboflavin kinase/FAD synthetase [Moraxella nasovis]